MAEKTYKIDLNVIVDQTYGASQTPEQRLLNGSNQTVEQAQQKTNNNEKQGNSALLFLNQYAQMGVTKLISNWGDMTGDYIAQENMQVLSSIVDTGLTALINWKVGLVKGAISIASGVGSYYKRVKESERVANWNLKRVGYGYKE